jgi:predicted  nucleic acid-binding Zn-ribbon protein
MTDNTPKNDKADKEWADLQRDLDTLGEQLNALREHSTALGSTLMANLEARYQDVRTRALGYRTATEEQIETMRKLALEQAAQTQNTFSETTTKSAEMAKDTARQMWDRSEPLRQGAQEVGQGLVRAWSELAASFGKAAEKIQAEKNKASTGEENHKTG